MYGNLTGWGGQRGRGDMGSGWSGSHLALPRHPLPPQHLEHRSFHAREFGVLEKAGAVFDVIEARDGITAEDLLEGERVVLLLDQHRAPVLEWIARQGAPPKRGIVCDDARRDAVLAADADPLDHEVAEGMIVAGTEDRIVDEEFSATVQKIAIRLREVAEPLEILDLGALLILLDRTEERCEVLVPSGHQLAFAPVIFLHPPEDSVERGHRVLRHVVDDLLLHDVLLQELLHRLVEHSRALARAARELPERAGVIDDEPAEDGDLGGGEPGIEECGLDTGGDGVHANPQVTGIFHKVNRTFSS